MSEAYTEQDETLYCQWHPQTETALRCYQCDVPICAKCAKRTPVGYICRNCQKGRKHRFEQAHPTDYVIAAVVSLILGGIAGTLLPMVGWFVIFLSPLAGTIIAEAVWRLVRRRYSDRLWWIVSGGIILGALPVLLLYVAGIAFAMSNGVPTGGIGALWSLVHMGMAVGSAIARLRLR